MNNIPQLTAHYAPKKLTIRETLRVMLSIAFIALMCFIVPFLTSHMSTSVTGLMWPRHLINIMLYGGLIFFVAGIFFSYIFTYEGPAIALDQRGIWVRHFNFIPWENVEKIGIYTLWGTPTEVIGVRIKNVAPAYHNAERIGKIRLWWTKRFGSYHLGTLARLDVNNEEVMKFIEQHISTDHPHIVSVLKKN